MSEHKPGLLNCGEEMFQIAHKLPSADNGSRGGKGEEQGGKLRWVGEQGSIILLTLLQECSK